MNVRIFSLLIILSWVSVCRSQEKYKELKIGDPVPEVVLSFVNRKNIKNNLSDYRGKLLIIDFWSIFCAPCINALPELSKIQKEMKEEVYILAVEGGNPINKVKEFLNKQKKSKKNIELPVAYISNKRNDPLYQMFPILNYGFPVEVWIDEKGNLVGITSQSLVNVDNIKKVIFGDTSVLIQKKYQKDFDMNKAFLVKNNGGPDTAFMYRSMITKFIDSIPTSKYLNIQKNSRFTRLFFANQTISSLVKLAIYHEPKDLHNKQLELDVTNPSFYLMPTRNSDNLNFTGKQNYCYELFLPPNRNIDDAFKFMLSDIERFFGIQVKIEDKQVKCLVLEKLSPNPLKSVNKISEYKETVNKDYLEVNIQNNSFGLLTSYLNKPDYPLIIDKTGIEYPVDIHLKTNKNYNLEDLQQSLNKIGISAKEQTMVKQVIVILDHK